MPFPRAAILLAAIAAWCMPSIAETPHGLEELDWQSARSVHEAEMELIAALKEPLIQAQNVEKALECWFRGRRAAADDDLQTAIRNWQQGIALLDNLESLPKAEWSANPDAELELLETVNYPGTEGVSCRIVSWSVDDLRQYGILIKPVKLATAKLPVILYLHGAAFGVPLHALPWLAGMAKQGYVIIGPALRGEHLFSSGRFSRTSKYKSEGEIENFDGEVNDALAAVAAVQKQPYAAPGKFAVIGHSFGAGVGLLVAARTDMVACTISYDAWLTNPFRYYWDRMRRGPNNWLSWAEYCDQPVSDQLRGLMKRSVTHHAERITGPLLMLIGGAYEGSVFHLSHQDFITQLKKFNKQYVYDVVPDGGHNFVLYYDSEPARYAYKKHMRFLHQHLPPAKP